MTISHRAIHVAVIALHLATLLVVPTTRAANVSINAPDGNTGTLGISGSFPPGSGGAGESGVDAAHSLSNNDISNSLVVSGGAGGFGGAGGQTGDTRGVGGAGGRGGDATALLEQNVNGSGTAEARGGRGGLGGDGAQGGASGAGGNAISAVAGEVASGNVDASAISRGGNGGYPGDNVDLSMPSSIAGNGGAASAAASAITLGGGEARALAAAYGGSGGGGYLGELPGVAGGQVVVDAYAFSALGDARATALAIGGGGGSGDGASVSLVDAARGAATGSLYLEQSVAGGSIGYGRAGDAFSSLTATNTLGGSTFAIVSAGGGDAHFSTAGAAVTGGVAVAEAHISGGSVNGGVNTGAVVTAAGGQGAGATGNMPGAPGALRRAGDGGTAVVLPSSVVRLGDPGFGQLSLTTEAFGGAGGDLGSDPFDSAPTNVGMMAGDGADVAMFNSVAGAGADDVRLTQRATGGAGGNGGQGGQGGNGGDAVSALDIAINISNPTVRVVAIGGDAGIAGSQDVSTLPVAKGGDATASAIVRNDGGRVDLNGGSQGGNGNWLRGFLTDLADDDRLGGQGGNAATHLLGQTSRDGADLFVRGTAQGGNGAWVDSLPGELRGGEAGNAVSDVTGFAMAAQSNVVVNSTATGGDGATGIWSTGHQAAVGRDGGAAEALGSAINHGGRETTVTVMATGGNGGSAGGFYDGTLTSGNGAEATAFATVDSSGGGPVTVTVQQIGGTGGGGLSGANGGNGAASHLLNAMSIIADGSLTLVQDAQGGNGGGFYHLLTDHDVLGGDGGAASSELDFVHAGDLDATVRATGGASGFGIPINFPTAYRVLNGHGGNADARLNASAGGVLRTEVTAIGGDSYSFDRSDVDLAGGAASALQVVGSSSLDAAADHRVRSLAVGGLLGGDAESFSSGTVAAGTLEVNDVAFAYRGGANLRLVTSHAEGVSSGYGRLTVDAQALLGDAYFSSVSEPFLQDLRGPLPPPATQVEARASAVAESHGNVLATARAASLALVDAQTSARAMSNGGQGAIAQADTGYEARGTTAVDATSSVEAGFGALRSVSAHAEAGGGVGLRAAASMSADGLLEDPNLAPVGLLVVASGAPPLSPSAITQTTSTTLGEIQLAGAFAAHSTLRATSTFVLNAQGLNPFAHLFVRYLDNGAATDIFTLDLLLDDISLWQLGFGALNAASATGAVYEINLGMVGTLMNGDQHELRFDFDFLVAPEPSAFGFSISFGTTATTAVPVPPAIYGFATLLLVIATRRRYA